MFGRTRALVLALLMTQLTGCCCCQHPCFHPFFNRWHDGCAAPCETCSSCYGPAPPAAAPVVPYPYPYPPATVAPPPASGTGTSTDGKMTPIPSFNASIYGTSRVR